MIESVSLGTLGIGSGWALVALFVITIIRGGLVPRRTYDDKIHEAQEWRTESRLKDQQIAEKDAQLGHLAEVGRTIEKVFRTQQERERDRR